MTTDKLKVAAAIREALEAGPREIYTDLLGDRYFTDDYSQATLTKAQDAFVTACSPEAITTVLDALDAALERAKVLEADAKGGAQRWLAVVQEVAESAKTNAASLRKYSGSEQEARARELAAQYLVETAQFMAADERHVAILERIADHGSRMRELHAAIDSAATAGKGTT